MNIEKMALKDLVTLQCRINDAMTRAKTRERLAIRAQVVELVSAAGFSVKEVLSPSITHRENRAKVSAIRFRNPDDHAQTWVGRGRRPLWMNGKDPKACEL